MYAFILLQDAAPANGGGGMSFLLMMVAIFAIMYFFMIRPQNKRQKEIRKFQSSLERGQEVVTSCGIYGVVKEVTEKDVMLEISKNVIIRIDKNAVLPNAASIPPSKQA